MSLIELNNVIVDIPVFNARTRSLKNKLIHSATGGHVAHDQKGLITVRTLDSVSFNIAPGERVGLIGHNGAGKTSLLRVLGKIYHPTGGSAKISGKISSLMDISLGIDPELTGRENLYLRGALLGLSRRDISAHMEEMLEFSELGPFVDLPLRTYSSGMHLRLAFTVSTIMQPEILLMDEWLSVGDSAFHTKMENRLKSIVQSTDILVIASHDLSIVRKWCTRVIWLSHGKVSMDGTPNEVLDCAKKSQVNSTHVPMPIEN